MLSQRCLVAAVVGAIFVACGGSTVSRSNVGDAAASDLTDAGTEAGPSPPPLGCIGSSDPACAVVECTDPRGCACPAGRPCAFDCTGRGRNCAGGSLSCSDSASCNLVCTGQSCGATSLDCGASECHLGCYGEGACDHAYVGCGAGPCEVSCASPSACSNLFVKCGAGPCKVTCATPNPSVEVECGEASSCINDCK